jgi:hypothetical protein
MYEAEIITWWVDDGAGKRADLADKLAPGDSAVDVTGQPAYNIVPAPNVVIFRLECGSDTIAAIQARPDYGNVAILWMQEQAIEIELEPAAAMALAGVPMVSIFGRSIPVYTTRLGRWIYEKIMEVYRALQIKP